MSKAPTSDLASEQFDFRCVEEDCDHTVAFSIGQLDENPVVLCDRCRCAYHFEEELIDKFRRFAELLKAVQNAQDILGDMNVGIQVDGHSLKIPFRLLLTRMNTLISLRMGDQKVDFHVRVHPLADLENGSS